MLSNITKRLSGCVVGTRSILFEMSADDFDSFARREALIVPDRFAPDRRILLTFSHPRGVAMRADREEEERKMCAEKIAIASRATTPPTNLKSADLAASSNSALHADRFVMSFGISVSKRTIPAKRVILQPSVASSRDVARFVHCMVIRGNEPEDCTLITFAP